jgi:dTDP-glucose pyrophosphorylase
MNELYNICIEKEATILSALERMDKVNRKLLILTDYDKFHSLVSIGDIQRAILAKIDLANPVHMITRKNIRVALDSDNLEKVKERMRINRNEFMPIISKDNTIVDIIFWNDLFDQDEIKPHKPLSLPVVIMAGGKGTRLKPITNILPKPLIPLGEKTILEEIMDKFVNAGCNTFYLSVNYKAEMISYYFENIKNENYHIEYFKEDKPLGTAGSMYLIKNKINTTFFVSNCDIIIDQDLHEVFNYHKENDNVITIVSVLKHYHIPYGTIETGNNGVLKKLTEKPKLTFQINSGMYLLEPEVLQSIPNNQFFHITDLIEIIQYNGGKVGVFPVSEGSWKDIGEWDEYLKNTKNVT